MKNFIIPSAILGVAMVIGLWILGHNILEGTKTIRYVSVKGLAEKEVTADKGSWILHSEFAGVSADATKSKANEQLEIIKKVLKEKGFSDEEISVVEFNIRQNYYGNNNQLPYMASIQVSVFTEKVDLLERVTGNINELIERGIELSGDRWMTRPRYYFTRINDIKPELLTEATKAAESSAAEFAANSGAEVEGIKYANQGIITLIPASRVSESEEFYKDKIARVVSTVDYFIDD